MQLSRYEVLDLLGAGGMGEVYRARDPRLDRLVAIKVISEQFALNPTWRERFRREARVLAALTHPNIAVIYGVEEEKEVLLLTMELVEGQSLAELVRAGGMPVERLLKIATQIADALAAAHASRVTHRDLKPANVLVTPDGRAKVLDFGLAKLARPSEGSDATTVPPADLTDPGFVVGTASYMSPEQAEGRPIDYRSDIFSFGIVLYELATGERPFKGQSVLSILSSIVRDTPPPPLEVNPRLPRELSRIIRRCLAKDPEERYQSAKDLRNDLSDLRQDLSSASSHRTVPLSPQRKSLRWVLLAGIALVLMAGGWILRQVASGGQAAFLPANISQLTFDPGIEMTPSISPDGKWIVYGKRVNERTDVYLQAVGGENTINLTKDSDGGGEQPAFSPDGERIAFRSTRQGGGLFVMGRTGELVRRVTDAGFNPSWAPDGNWLAYSSTPAGDFPSAHPGGASLWIVNVSTADKRRLSVPDALQPAWSPDDKWIAYWGVDAKTLQRDLFTVAPRGGTPVRVTDDPANDISPSWSADGKYLYFSSDRGGTLNLWRVQIDASSGRAVGPIEPITAPNVNAVHATQSNDGRRIAYATFTWTTNVYSVPFDPVKLETHGTPSWLVGGHLWTTARVSPDANRLALVRWSQMQDLFLINTDGNGLRRVTSDPHGVRCPEWSPDSTRIVYRRSLQADASILLVDVATGNVTPLTTAAMGTPLGCPAWSRDSTRIAIGKSEPGPAAFVFTIARSGQAGDPERLPDHPEGTFIPRSWSPDGQRLAGTIGSRIATYSIQNRKYELVTPPGSAVSASFTDWLPDGQHLIFPNPSAMELLVVDVHTKASSGCWRWPHSSSGARASPGTASSCFSVTAPKKGTSGSQRCRRGVSGASSAGIAHNRPQRHMRIQLAQGVLIPFVFVMAAAAVVAQPGAQDPPQGAKPAPPPPQPGGRGQGRGTFPAQQRPAGDPQVIERGRTLYSVTCSACHGVDARGGQLGGPNLLRSQLVLNDQDGELIVPVIQSGRPDKGMPPMPVSAEDGKALAVYLHSVLAAAGRQGSPPPADIAPLNILVGDADAGRTYFEAKCAACHSASGDLQGIAARIPDPKVLQNIWVSGGTAGGRGGRGRRGGGGGAGATPNRRQVTVTVTLASGEKAEGTLARIDDFLVVLVQEDGTQRSFRRDSDSPKVEVHDPLQGHRDLLLVYKDKDMHDVTAFLATLK